MKAYWATALLVVTSGCYGALRTSWPDADFSTIEWTAEQLARLGYLVDLEKALLKLVPLHSDYDSLAIFG